ncbi:MAG: hypothetical protein ACREPS_02610 [Rhodanobacteraceae bacterium]
MIGAASQVARPQSVIIPVPPAQLAGGIRNPALIFGIGAKSWIPGSIANEAGEGPGMTKVENAAVERRF